MFSTYYQQGLGGAKNKKQAATFYKEATDLLYKDTEETDKNYELQAAGNEEAATYNQKAADMGNARGSILIW